MRVSLGAIEVNDVVRRALRAYVGKSGLATRQEVRDMFRSLASADIDSIVAEQKEPADAD